MSRIAAIGLSGIVVVILFLACVGLNVVLDDIGGRPAPAARLLEEVEELAGETPDWDTEQEPEVDGKTSARAVVTPDPTPNVKVLVGRIKPGTETLDRPVRSEWVTQGEWAVILFTQPDGSVWRLEINPEHTEANANEVDLWSGSPQVTADGSGGLTPVGPGGTLPQRLSVQGTCSNGFNLKLLPPEPQYNASNQ